MADRTVRYHGVSWVAGLFGVPPETVSKWLIRHQGWPEPDADTDGVKGWLPTPEREREWLDWKASLPGRGAPGRPKPRVSGSHPVP